MNYIAFVVFVISVPIALALNIFYETIMKGAIGETQSD